MIIQALIDLILNVFAVLTLPIQIPSTPDELKEVLAMALEYMTMGVKVVSNYCDIRYLLLLFGAIIYVDVGIFVYKTVMWVIRKIPFTGIT